MEKINTDEHDCTYSTCTQMIIILNSYIKSMHALHIGQIKRFRFELFIGNKLSKDYVQCGPNLIPLK